MTTCCESSSAAGEQLFGTAPDAHTWVLVEHAGEWTAKALQDANLPPGLKALLLDFDTRPGIRVQLIQRPDRRRGPKPHAVFVATTRPTPRLLRAELASYDRYADLDLPGRVGLKPELVPSAAELKGDAGSGRSAGPWQSTEPVLLVCTNGRRDVCCARHGTTFFAAAAATMGEHVWQTTHLGGHRFAATAVSLPLGLLFGRLTAADAPSLAAMQASGFPLGRLRGRAELAPPAQAAEYYLWRELTRASGTCRLAAATVPIDALRPVALETVSGYPGRWKATIGSHVVEVEVDRSALAVLKSSTDVAAVPVDQFRLIGIETGRL